MRLESYAQELEDVVLYVVLRDISEGFYIDIGANDPVKISVTKFFYDMGWHGINVEPLRSSCALLDEKRRRDINLCVGIDSVGGVKSLIAAGTGSTFSKQIAEAGGFANCNEHKKTMLKLSDIYEQYCTKQQQIHFCKIDVEGYERQVLESVDDWNVYRPWVFVVESAKPGTSMPSYMSWENILLDNGYIMALGTRLNRFYLDTRKEHLMERFDYVEEFIRSNEIVKMEMVSAEDVLKKWK